jgi:hypothetical protein
MSPHDSQSMVAKHDLDPYLKVEEIEPEIHQDVIIQRNTENLRQKEFKKKEEVTE